MARLQNMIVLDPGAIDGYLATLSGPDVVRTMFRLAEDERQVVLVALAPETAAEFIEDVPDEVAADLIEGLPVGRCRVDRHRLAGPPTGRRPGRGGG